MEISGPISSIITFNEIWGIMDALISESNQSTVYCFYETKVLVGRIGNFDEREPGTFTSEN